MDLKGLAWIGNIYEKFETMCLEVEEVMYQDTVKYVENQVQNVGASVKKFYSEVMQDLDPESHIHPVKVAAAAADLSLNPYAHVEMMQKSSGKKDPCENTEKFTDDCKVISGKDNIGVYRRPIARRRGHSSVNYSRPVSGSMAPMSGNVISLSSFSQRRGSHEVVSDSIDVRLPAAIEGNSEEAKENICNQVVYTSGPPCGASADFPLAETETSTLSSGRKQADSGDISYASYIAMGTSGSCTNREVISETDQAKSDADLRKSGEEVVVMAHKERLDDCSNAAKNDDIIKQQDGEIMEKFDESMLAETCVVVEEDVFCFVHHSNDKHKSYKKKLREAFSTRSRSTRKEYEKLAAQYKEQSSNQESTERLSSSIGDSSAKLSPVHSFPDSDWELL